MDVQQNQGQPVSDDLRNVVRAMVQECFADYVATRTLFDPEYTRPLVNDIVQELEWRLRAAVSQEVKEALRRQAQHAANLF